MSEIYERNRYLRLAVNIALIAAYVVIAVWQLGLLGAEEREIKTLEGQMPILEKDVALKEQSFLTEQTLLDMTRERLTPREAVERSQKLQEMRESLEGSRNQLTAKREARDELQQRRRSHNLILIVGLVVLAVLLWVNWVINY
jgi:ferric-dicitrate binding protein FerR (iron transport regulator)